MGFSIFILVIAAAGFFIWIGWRSAKAWYGVK